MNTYSSKKVFHNFFSLGFVQVINALLQLLVIPYVIARVGMENYGVVAVAQVVMFYLATFADYGFNLTATRDVSVHRDNPELIAGVFYRVFVSKLILCVFAFLLLLLLSAVFPFIRQHFVLYCMAFMFVPGQAAIPSWFFQGMERMQVLALLNLFSRLLFVALVFLFVKGPGDTALFLFFSGLGNLVAGIAGMLLAIRLFGLRRQPVSRTDIIRLLREGWPVTISNLSMNVIQYGNIFILRIFTNDLVAGYYGVAERIFFAIKQGLVIFSQAVYPRVCQLAGQGLTGVVSFFRRVFAPFFLVVVAGCAVVAAAAPYILHFFTKDNNSAAIFALRMFCLLIPVICLNIPGTLSLLAFNRKESYFAIYTGAAVLCIVANLLLARYFQAEGTIAAIFITEICITAGVSLAISRYSRQISTHT